MHSMLSSCSFTGVSLKSSPDIPHKYTGGNFGFDRGPLLDFFGCILVADNSDVHVLGTNCCAEQL